MEVVLVKQIIMAYIKGIDDNFQMQLSSKLKLSKIVFLSSVYGTVLKLIKQFILIEVLFQLTHLIT